MLKRADNILNHLEDPQGTRNRESPTDEPQDDVTPVYAAQVLVPNNGSEEALAAALSAVENGILREQSTPQPASSGVNVESPATPMSVEQNQEATEHPEAQASSSSASTSSSSQNEPSSPQNTQSGRLPE